ncbi:hypothetical protein CCR75_001700 [Bremia lactucae]|uniref:START domain-containing protein n=1 Tax=Bremia lactucae TaxID=4779 RepID=A0A976IBN7_BRELC|nr:hypothetical protein CCR75_001700 [Bremia lactucae]
MADSTFLDDIVGFLHNDDDLNASGGDMLPSLDKEDSVLSTSDAQIPLQLSNVPPSFDLLFRSHHQISDSDYTSHDTESNASSSNKREKSAKENRTRDAKRRIFYRQKRKAEKEDLYQEYKSLSTQLTALRVQKELDKVKRGCGLASAVVWKALASRHLHARLLAETQQRRLKEAVARRSAVIRDLNDIIQKKLKIDQFEGSEMVSSMPSRLEAPDWIFYETLINELDQVYAQTDYIFHESATLALSTLNGGYRCGALPRKSKYHELVGTMTLPFPLERVRYIIRGVEIMESRPGYEKLWFPGIPNNTIVARCQFQAETGNGSFVQHLLTRHFDETERKVMVWRKFTEGDGAYAGMHIDETGWNVIRRSPDGKGTVIESISRSIPMPFSSVVNLEGVLKEFADTIIDIGKEECQKCVRKLDILLRNDARARYPHAI